jgi:hypothetical protein
MLSRCCKAYLTVEGANETAYFVCDACHRPAETFSVLVISDMVEYCNDRAMDESGGDK